MGLFGIYDKTVGMCFIIVARVIHLTLDNCLRTLQHTQTGDEMAERTVVYRADDGTIICMSCACLDDMMAHPVLWEDLNDGTEQTPYFCDSCSAALCVEKF